MGNIKLHFRSAAKKDRIRGKPFCTLRIQFPIILSFLVRKLVHENPDHTVPEERRGGEH